MVPALLKWVGNKQRFAHEIISYMPETFNNYYEPFLGSGAVLAELLDADRNALFPHFSHAYGSDILPFLIDVFNLAKTNPSKLTLYYQNEINDYYKDPLIKYKEIRDRFNVDHNALDFCLLSRTCYSGIIRFRKNDGYMSTPCGPHKPIKPETFERRVAIWNQLLEKATFSTEDFVNSMNKPQQGDIVYCDPPYTHSQSILYGAQDFEIQLLWEKIEQCKKRGAKIMLSINGTRESKKKDLSVEIPSGLFSRQIIVDCGTSMIDRLQNTGEEMLDEKVHDLLLLTW